MDPLLIAEILTLVKQGIRVAMDASDLAEAYRKGELSEAEVWQMLRNMQAAFQAGDDAWLKAGESEA